MFFLRRPLYSPNQGKTYYFEYDGTKHPRITNGKNEFLGPSERHRYQDKFATTLAQTYHPDNEYIISFLPAYDNFNILKWQLETENSPVLYHNDFVKLQRMLELDEKRMIHMPDNKVGASSPGLYCFVQIPENRLLTSKHYGGVANAFNIICNKYPYHTVVFSIGLSMTTLFELKALDRDGVIQELVVLADPEFYEDEIKDEFKARVKYVIDDLD